jgi:uncharacterized membrane protein YesL
MVMDGGMIYGWMPAAEANMASAKRMTLQTNGTIF